MLHINMCCVKAAYSFEWAANTPQWTEDKTCIALSGAAHTSVLPCVVVHYNAGTLEGLIMVPCTIIGTAVN